MQTTYNQYPKGWHIEVNEDGQQYQHPGYELVRCNVCSERLIDTFYPEAMGITHKYNCGDLNKHKGRS